jgi:hypothetical protein
VVPGELWTRLLGLGSWNRTAGTGQPGQERQVRTGDLGRDIWDQTTGAGLPRQVELDKSGG